MKSQISTPCVGPWYYLYLRPKWRLFANPLANDKDWLGHPDFWKKLTVEVVAPFFEIKAAKKIDLISQLCYAFPRGRCSKLICKTAAPSAWALYYGGTFPKGLKGDPEKKKLLRAFGLKIGQSKFVADEHETMQDDDQRRLQEIIGKVPY